MKLLINNTTQEIIDFKDDLENLVKEVMRVEKLSENIEISLTFVDKEEIKELNKDYRNIDKVTDVLSFPLYNNKKDIKKSINEIKVMDESEKDLDSIDLMLGDIVICMDVAKEQAKEFNHSLKRELVYLSCHSLLHLLGYDHIKEDDKKKMRSVEKEIMKNLGVFK